MHYPQEHSVSLPEGLLLWQGEGGLYSLPPLQNVGLVPHRVGRSGQQKSWYSSLQMLAVYCMCCSVHTVCLLGWEAFGILKWVVVFLLGVGRMLSRFPVQPQTTQYAMKAKRILILKTIMVQRKIIKYLIFVVIFDPMLDLFFLFCR